MRDLYKRLGLAGPTDDFASIRSTIDECADLELKETCQHILLDASRKRVYDQNRQVISMVHLLRQEFGIDDTALFKAQQHSDFRQSEEDSRQGRRTPSQDGRQGRGGSGAVGTWSIVIGVCTIFILYLIDFSDPQAPPGGERNQSIPETPIERDAARTADPAALPAVVLPSPTPRPTPSPLPLPPNGLYAYSQGASRIAPLEIITRRGDGNYFLKLLDWYSKAEVLSFFVRDGNTFEINVPLGKYELLYASGANWYGERNSFGAETSYSKADEMFEFTQDSRSVSGHTVTLYRVARGNLSTSNISPEEFMGIRERKPTAN